MALFAQILGWMLAVWEMNPGLCSLILQVTLLVCAFLCVSCCARRTAASSHSVRVHVYHSGEVFVDVDQSEPARAPGTPGRFGQLGPAPQGRSPDTAARPINLGSQSERLRVIFFLSRMSQWIRWILILPSRIFHVAPGQRPAAVPQRPVYIAPS